MSGSTDHIQAYYKNIDTFDALNWMYTYIIIKIEHEICEIHALLLSKMCANFCLNEDFFTYKLCVYYRGMFGKIFIIRVDFISIAQMMEMMHTSVKFIESSRRRCQ